MATSPTQRTLAYLKRHGYTAGIVERFIPIPGSFGRRIDLFNIIDIIALKDDEIWGIQSCGQAFAEHNKTILENEVTPKWLCTGAKLMLIGWRKLKVERGKKRIKWEPRIKEYSLVDLEDRNEK